MINLKEFLARQLNDHSESPSGVVQKTFYEWTETHIEQAIELAKCYVYSLVPQEFVELREFTVTEADNIFNMKELCPRFINLAGVESSDGDSVDASEKDGEIRSLINLLDTKCSTSNCSSNNSSLLDSDEDEEEELQDLTYDVLDGTKDVLVFSQEVPVGTVFRYACASSPTDANLDDDELCQYHGLIADYALWWLFRTDSESRSNLDRARLHFESMQSFVQQKLLIEFSLREDDYNFARRKVDD